MSTSNICSECGEFIGLPQHHRVTCSRYDYIPQPESVRDFRARIAGIMRGDCRPESEIIYHPPKVLPSIFRKPTDRGYYPPSRSEPNRQSGSDSR